MTAPLNTRLSDAKIERRGPWFPQSMNQCNAQCNDLHHDANRKALDINALPLMLEMSPTRMKAFRKIDFCLNRSENDFVLCPVYKCSIAIAKARSFHDIFVFHRSTIQTPDPPPFARSPPPMHRPFHLFPLSSAKADSCFASPFYSPSIFFLLPVAPEVKTGSRLIFPSLCCPCKRQSAQFPASCSASNSRLAST